MSALDSARGKGAQVSEKVAPYAASAKDSAVHYAGEAREWATPRVEAAVGTAKDWAAPRVEAARDWAAPHLGSAVEVAKDRAGKARDELAPKVAAGLAAVAAASEPVLEEAKKRGAPALAALRGEEVVVKKRRSGWGRRLLLLLGLGGLAAAAYAAWQKSQGGGLHSASTASTGSPASAGVPTTLDAEVSRNDVGGLPAHDTAGASPDEAVADAATANSDEPLPPATPQAPPAGDGTGRIS